LIKEAKQEEKYSQSMEGIRRQIEKL